MFAEHESFPQPSSEEVRVWRYLDFTKLVALLETKTLHFTRLDQFADKFEGSWPASSIAEREVLASWVPEPHKGMARAYVNTSGPRSIALRSETAANCWHINDHESAAMWTLYLANPEGVAVQSTYSRLRRSFEDARPIYLGLVTYIDYAVERIDIYNLFNAMMHKRKSFEHEREVRAVVVAKQASQLPQEGVDVPVSLDTLVDSIFVAPTSAPWFVDLVKSVLLKYGCKAPVRQSRLSEDPLF